ncbi:Hypothetical protein R9X50_00065100 [Acrodontium crateriforme]|uniref:Cytochrome P450 n=1 Tax=Acrodontium crateriforme TaxID=150365 RepID=A0AAQ3R7C4_9PEZI|nr:Hypothetical protein R9X50_00065100 [Acrodontium crateriforme]
MDPTAVLGPKAILLARAAVIIASGGLILSVLAYFIYALYFHPLAKYPGPLLGRLTQWYDVYHAYKGDKHIVFYQLHQKYGSVVRFSPNALSINDPAALKVIYAHGANVQKSTFYKCFRAAPNAVSTLLATDKEQHARKRRVVGQAFSDQALRGLEQYVLENVQTFIDRINEIFMEPRKDQNSWSTALDMHKYCNWLVFDIMGDLVFGKSFGTLGAHPENREGIRLLGRAAKRNYIVAAMPALITTGAEKWLPGLSSLYWDRLKYFAFGKAQVMARTKEHAKGDTGRKDIFSFLMRAKDPETGEGFPMPELWMEGNTLIVAGSDTTSTTLSAAIFYLLNNPETLARLEKEIRSTYSSAYEIRMGPQLQSCAYLRACLDETMRLSPALPGVLHREILPGGLRIPDLDLDLPAGIDVGVPIYSIHHHAECVYEPFAFLPGRWLGEEKQQSKEGLQAVFNPFSLGHRGCLGKPLVYMELGIALARLVFEYDMRLAKKQDVSEEFLQEVKQGKRHDGEYHTRDWFLSVNEGPQVEFRRVVS